MTRRTVLKSAAVASAVLNDKVFAQIEPPNARNAIQQYMKAYDVPGISVIFLRGSEPLFSQGFGIADRDTRAPVVPNSLFRIASNSKAFTSASIFLLVEAGKLTLDSRVFSPDGILRQYSNIGPHRDWLHTITVHHLLTHTAGGWGNENNDPMFEERGLNHEELISYTLRTHSLQNPPGQKYAYSNFGYCVLGRVIEAVSGMPYAQFVHQRVLFPIGIRDMRIATHRPAEGEVTYYGQGGEQPYNIPITRMDSHGGWISTATDMARFLANLFTPQDREQTHAILTIESLRQMTQGTSANQGYACGLAVNRAGNAWHNGSLPGTTSLMVHTHTGLSWAAVANTRSKKDSMQADLDRLMWTIARSVPQWRAG